MATAREMNGKKMSGYYNLHDKVFCGNVHFNCIAEEPNSAPTEACADKEKTEPVPELPDVKDPQKEEVHRKPGMRPSFFLNLNCNDNYEFTDRSSEPQTYRHPRVTPLTTLPLHSTKIYKSHLDIEIIYEYKTYRTYEEITGASNKVLRVHQKKVHGKPGHLKYVPTPYYLYRDFCWPIIADNEK